MNNKHRLYIAFLLCSLIPQSILAQLPQELVVRSNGEKVYIWEDPVYLTVFIAFIAVMVGYYLFRRNAQKKREEEDKKVD